MRHDEKRLRECANEMRNNPGLEYEYVLRSHGAFAVEEDAERLEWLEKNAKIVWWPKDGGYPVEHAPLANKKLPNFRQAIDAAMSEQPENERKEVMPVSFTEPRKELTSPEISTEKVGAQELKPCPFCGENEIEIYSREVKGKDVFMSTCLCCHCDGPCGDGITEQDVINAWNTRPNQQTGE